MSARSARRWGLGAVALCTAAALTTACGGPSAQSKNAATARKNVRQGDVTPAATGTLAKATWLMPKEPVNLDLTSDRSDDQSDLIMANVCERLNKLNPNLTVSPGLASKFEWTTPKTLVFTLRQNVTFHDGTPMTADDVLWSMKRNATKGNSESDEFVNVSSVEKTGANQITFHMTQPDAVFVEALAGDAGVVQERRSVETQGKAFGTPSGKDACSGPFELKQWTAGQQIVITKAAHYWNTAEEAKTNEVTFKWADDDAVVNSLLTGSAQGAYLETISSAARLAGKGSPTTVAQGPDTRVWSLMATERGGLKDVRLRRALSLALDRAGVDRAALADFGQPWKQPVGSGAWGYEKATFQAADNKLQGSPAKPTAADISAAKKLVAQVGTTQPLVVASDGTPVRNALANAIVSAAQQIGLKASIIVIPTTQYGDFYDDPAFRKKADLWSDDYFISKNDPVGFYKNGASTSEVQWLLKDPAYDKLVKRARAAIDPKQRAQLAIQLAQRWADAKPWISAVLSPTTVVLSDKVTGVPSSGCYRYYPWAADLGVSGTK